MTTNGTRSPDAIIADIEAIRSEMDSTLHAIEQRLTPGQMIDQGLDYLRNSGGREFMTNLGTSVKTNPLPATLVGIGLAWLMVTQQRDRRPGLTGRVDYDRAGIDTLPGEMPPGAEDGTSLRDRAGAVRAKVGDMAGRASDAAAATRDRVSGAMSAVRDRATDTAQRARDFASTSAQRARDTYAMTSDMARAQMDRARSGYRQVVQEQPLALGAVGLGIGALIAALAPRTRQEDRLMGEAADSLKQRAVEAGHEQLGRAGERARTAIDEATKKMGGTSGTSTASDQERADPSARGTTSATSTSTSSATPPLTGDAMARTTPARSSE